VIPHPLAVGLFIVKQLSVNGISEFMKRLGNGYTKYFNYRYNHSGYLFQGKFKSIHIDTDEYLLWLSAYINLNSKLHKITNNLNKYPWSSYLDYINQRSGTLCNKDIILNQFPHKNYTYKNFMDNCLPEMKSRKDLKKYFIE
jgi:putative transposase